MYVSLKTLSWNSWNAYVFNVFDKLYSFPHLYLSMIIFIEQCSYQLPESVYMQYIVFKWWSLALNSTSEILGRSNSDMHSSLWHLAHLDSCLWSDPQSHKTNEQFFLLFLGSRKQTQRTALWDSDNANEAPSSASEV